MVDLKSLVVGSLVASGIIFFGQPKFRDYSAEKISLNKTGKIAYSSIINQIPLHYSWSSTTRSLGYQESRDLFEKIMEKPASYGQRYEQKDTEGITPSRALITTD